MLVAKAKEVIPGNSTQSQENTGSADGEPETEGKTTGEIPEADANSADDSENQENDGSDTGKAGQEGNSTGESSDTQNQPEQEATQAAAEDVNRVMPQAAAAGAGIIRRQIRHEKKVLTTAKEKAAQYDYDGAISLLQKDNAYVRNVHFQNAVQKFQKTKDKCVAWSSEQVTHIFYHSLIADTSKAFDGDYKTDGYNQVMTTMTEFNKITQIMYDKGYVMVNLYDLAGLDEDGRMKAKQIYLPKGKTPFVLSQDDVCYYHSQDGDGIATRLVVDDEGKVRNEYVQDDGSTVVGDYDVVPLIDRFVEEHPDFAYHGHKGIVALTGYNGILGYRTDISYQTRPDDLNDDKKAWLDAHPDFDLDTERAGAKKVADAMKAEGWTFASHTWGHKNMSTVSMERLQTDTENFKENVDPLIGGTDIIIFAFGADINGGGEYTGDEKFNYLKSQGYDYYCNVDSNKYFVQITDEYFRMGRRNVDGYRMYYNPELLSDLFDASEVFDSSRPTPVPPMNGG
ncbi:MAG: polysaccharide deacetylase family protein [Blautia faecis]